MGSWHLDVKNGTCLLLRWFYCLNHSSFFVCLFGWSEDNGEFFFGDWNVGARVLGYLDVENEKVYFSEVDVVIWPEKYTSFLCVCLVAKKMR